MKFLSSTLLVLSDAALLRANDHVVHKAEVFQRDSKIKYTRNGESDLNSKPGKGKGKGIVKEQDATDSFGPEQQADNIPTYEYVAEEHEGKGKKGGGKGGFGKGALKKGQKPLEESKIEANLHNGGGKADVMESDVIISDFPEPIDHNSNDWVTAKAYFSNVLGVINQKRSQAGEEPIQTLPGHWVLRQAWQKVESDTEGYKLCAQAMINGEEEFALIDMFARTNKQTGQSEAVLTSVTPGEAFLGEKVLAAVEHELPSGVDYEHDVNTQANFPCHPGMKDQVIPHHIGLNQNGASQFGHIYLGDAGLAAKKVVTGRKFPGEYNSREAYPACALPTRDQGGCGSCYAFAASSVIGERLCIERLKPTSLLAEEEKIRQTQAKWETTKARKEARARFLQQAVVTKEADETEHAFAAAEAERQAALHLTNATRAAAPVMATQELVSCGSSDSIAYQAPYCLKGPGGVEIKKYTNGCEGASLINSLFYVHTYGLPDETCTPYMSGGGDYSQHFDAAAGKVPTCDTLASNTCHTERALNKVGQPARCAAGNIDCIKAAIFEKGPVMASMMVTESFMSGYKIPADGGFADDVYIRPQGVDPEKGGHAVSLHGWGTANGTPFWWGRNSWGTGWGLGGLFKIRMGTNELNIENEVYFPETMVPDAAPPGDSECIMVEKVHADSVGTDGVTEMYDCILTNVCPTSVRQVTVTYLGSHNNCGSFTATIPRVMPGAENRVALNGAHLCRVKDDVEVDTYDPSVYYQDATSLFGGAYSCVLKNTYNGPGRRLKCCGNACAASAPGSYGAFPSQFCPSTGECQEGVTENSDSR